MRLFAGLFILTLSVALGTSAVTAQDKMDKMDDKMSKDKMSKDKMSKDGNPMVGGAAMFKTKNIVENAVNSKDHTTLVDLVKAAGLVDTLSGPGPFTVFAPVNNAFEQLPKEMVEMVLKPENKATLTKVLTYHVVAGNMDSKAIASAIKKGNGTAELTTVAGGKLKATMSGNNLVLTDEKGNTSTVTIADVRQSNGVIHVVDTVLLPS